MNSSYNTKICFFVNTPFVLQPRVVYKTRVVLPSAKKDSVPTTQKSCVVYEFLCQCEARYVGRTTQRLADRTKQHVPRACGRKVIPQENSHLVYVKTTSLKLIVNRS